MRQIVKTHLLFGLVLAVFGWMLAFESAYAAGRLSDYLSKAEPNELVPMVLLMS